MVLPKPNKNNTSHSFSVSHPEGDNHFHHLYLIIFVLFAFYMTLLQNGFYFKWAESLSLFVNSGYFFEDNMRSAGGLLAYAGAFLTQFYYFPALGSIIFIAMLVLIQYLSVIAFNIPVKWRSLAYIPSLMLLLSVTQLGYVWLTLKSPGYFFSNTLGVIVCLLAFRGYRLIPGMGWRIAGLVFFTIAGYPLLGFYTLLAVSLFVIYELRLYFRDKSYLHAWPVFTGVALAIAVPQVYYNYVYSYMQYIHIYIAGLPRFAFDFKELIFWVPFIMLAVTLFLFSGFAVREKDKTVKNEKSYLPLLVLCSSILVVYSFSFSNANFKTEIKMATAMERSNFRAVVYHADRVQGVPTRNIVLNKDFAQMAMGQPEAGNLNVNNNVVKPDCVRPSIPINLLMSGRPLYYLTGQINECYRWCMEEMVEYGMKASTLKYMVKCAIVNREYELAQKYNAVLSQTLFYGDWAEKYQAYIDNPRLTENDSEIMAMRNLSAKNASSDL